MKKYIFYFIAATMLLFTNCSKEKNDWKNARTKNTLEIFEQFLKDYPNSTFKDSANFEIEKLSFEKAIRTDSIPAYQEFKIKYSNSKWIDSIDKLIDKKEWEKVDTSINYEAYESYLNRYPNSQHASEVRSRMETTILKGTLVSKQNSSPIANCKVYLCEVKSDGKVNAIFSSLPQGKSDASGNFSISVKRAIFIKMKCFIFILQGSSLYPMMSDQICLKDIPADCLVINLGTSKIEE